MRVLYFAWVREKIGVAEEAIDLPAEVGTVADLLDHLAGRSEAHTDAFADRGRLRFALDQEFVAADAALGTAQELAVFPPVTGG